MPTSEKKTYKRRRKFSGTSRPRTFYDRKVLAHGYGRQLSLGRIIPKDWRYVRIQIISKTTNEITLKITKLLGAEINAPTKTTNKTSK